MANNTIKQIQVSGSVYDIEPANTESVEFEELTIDSSLSTSSENPVQNKVITTKTNDLQTQIDNLSGVGRFLSLWNASSGEPSSEPPTSPYTYKTGDYYRVTTSGERRPKDATTYTTGGTNWQDAGITIAAGSIYYYDGNTHWILQEVGGGTVTDVTINSQTILSGNVANFNTEGTYNASTNKVATKSYVDTVVSNKQDKSTAVTHTANTAVGSATQPIYVNSSGVATACTYSLNKTVPSNALFTDTVTTALTSGSGNAVTGITANNGALTVSKDATFALSTDLAGKLDKLTTTGEKIYYHNGTTQSEKTLSDSPSASALSSTSSNVVTERDVYYGLPTINGSHAYTSSTSIYAPTSQLSASTAKRYLVGASTTTSMSTENTNASCYMQSGYLYSNGTQVNMAAKEDISNKTTSITSSSTDTQYPSAKATKDYADSLLQVGDVNITLTNSSISDGTTTLSIAGKQDTLTAGNNVQINGTTISATDTTYSVVTTSVNGLMSSTDKTKLDSFAGSTTTVGSDSQPIYIHNGVPTVCTSAGGGGDVTGPSSSTDNAIARFDSTTGKIIQNSSVTIADDGSYKGAGSFSLNRKADTATGSNSVAIGYSATAANSCSYAEGFSTKSEGVNAHAEGAYTLASGYSSHAEGENTTASGNYSHAEGWATTASGNYSHAEGFYTEATSEWSHAEGVYSITSGYAAHAEGESTTASGYMSHAEGVQTASRGYGSHAEGYCTIASHKSQHVFGECNVTDPSSSQGTVRGEYIEIVGNGTSNSNPSNARTLNWSGNEWLAGTLEAAGGIKYLTTAPTSANTKGGLIFVVLSSEPTTKYSGYIYLITA